MKSNQTTQTKSTIVRLQDVQRTYRMGRHNIILAVQNISLEIASSEIVALTGPSGSGKSTILQLVGGLDQPTGGNVIVDGKDLRQAKGAQLAAFRNQTVGFVFQFFYLQPFLSVQKNVEIPLMFARTDRAARPSRVAEVLDAVGLTDRASHLPNELSGGQMQRVAIARALVNRPKILLADEPTGNLDSKNSASIMQLLADIRAAYGTTMIIVTHDVNIAARADRIIRIEDGRAVA